MAALDELTLLATVSEGNISYTKQGHQIFSIIMIMTELYECFYAHSHRLLSLELLFSPRMLMVSCTFMV